MADQVLPALVKRRAEMLGDLEKAQGLVQQLHRIWPASTRQSASSIPNTPWGTFGRATGARRRLPRRVR
ncbi:hypothetical protein ACVFYP_10175 [Roseomonas sp. F4]